jgi:signal transduction histidine kinase/ActR/RegA family two-component response regulator
VVALVLCAAGVCLYWIVPPALRRDVLFLPFYPAVPLAAWRGGFGPGALATLLSLAATVPLVSSSGDILRGAALPVFAATSLAVSIGFEALHRTRRRESRRRLEAERLCLDADRLQELTTALSKAASLMEVIEASVLEVTHSVGAAAGTIVLVSADGQTAELKKTVGLDHELVAKWRQFPLAARSPFSDALRTGAIIALDSRASRLTRYADLAGRDLFAEYEAVAVLPVNGRGCPPALLGLALSTTHEWTVPEREFLLQTSRRVAHALERARVYELAERARTDAESLRARADQELADRQKAEEALRDSEARYRSLAARTSRLHALTAALSEAVTSEAVARAVVRQGRVVVGAQSGSVIRLVDDGTQLATMYAEDVSSQLPEASERFPAESGLYSTEVIKERRPVFIASFAEWQRRYWRSAAHAADGGFASAAALPLVVEGTVLGVLTFHFTAPLNFDDEYRALLTSVAQHCAQALDRARLYEAELRARADAEAANRSKDEFLSIVSHELRTPLNAILGWASMLRAGTLDADKKTRAMQAICDNAARQAQLVDELLDVSRIISGRVPLDMRQTDLPETIRGAVEAMMPLAEAKGIELRFGPSLPVVVVADPRRLEQVFLNLLSNAVKFTPSGGRVDVTLAIEDSSVEVRVADTGIGMDPSFLPHAFDRFRQADSQPTRTQGGLGLGLSIASHLVDAHGGRISVHSDGVGRGTTCTVTLSVATIDISAGTRSAAGSDRSVEGRGIMPDLSGLCVLVVDDEADAREMMAAALERCGGTVMAAASVAEALEILEHTTVDVLLSDIGMPDEDGYALIRRVRSLPSRRTAAIPAAAVTAYARDDQRQFALAAGYQVHLPKPLDLHRLALTVATLAHSGAVSRAG